MPEAYSPFKEGILTKFTYDAFIDTAFSQNVFIDMNGVVRPHRFDAEGLWGFDGQFYIPPAIRKRMRNDTSL